MKDEQGYNGWKNYETWVTALWIDNDEGSYDEAREIVASARQIGLSECPFGDDAADLRDGWVHSHVADALSLWVEDVYENVVAEMNNGHASLFGDLLGAAWSVIEWREIAANIMSEVDA